MHELSIAADLLDQLLDTALANRLSRIVAVELHVGAARLVVPDALRDAFAAISAGTLADGATLEMIEVPIRARCRGCGAEFTAEVDDYLCPTCGQADVELVAGHDIILQSIQGDQE